MWGTLPGSLEPTLVGQWDPSLVTLQGWVTAPVQEAWGNKVGTGFLSISLISCLCYVSVWSICNAVTVVSIQPPDSGMMNLWEIYTLC